jgi:hypothetical protein
MAKRAAKGKAAEAANVPNVRGCEAFDCALPTFRMSADAPIRIKPAKSKSQVAGSRLAQLGRRNPTLEAAGSERWKANAQWVESAHWDCPQFTRR